jgi:choline dehydrogenase-like flavoprotein
VGYDDLEPYYATVERHMTVTAGDPQPRVPANVRTFTRRPPQDWLDLAERVRPHGHSLGAMPMAQGRPTTLVARPTGWNSYHCMIKPLLDAPNFTLVRDAQVVRLDWSGAEGRVRAVEYVDRVAGGAPHRLPCRAVVVAAGALDTTRILLQSRSDDFPTGLGNTEGLVGRYLHDHPRQWWPARLRQPMSLLAHPMYIARRTHGEDAPLMATSLTIGMVGQITRVKSWYGAASDVVGVQVFGTMVPREDHTAVLPPGRDLDEELRTPLRLDMRYDDQAVANIEDARERFREVFEIGGVGGEAQGPFHDLLPGSSVHYSGTVRMHADRRYGVLDGWNRIHDVPNVVVTDMSCFTTCPEKNPTLTAMALSARAVHRLAGELRSGAAA